MNKVCNLKDILLNICNCVERSTIKNAVGVFYELVVLDEKEITSWKLLYIKITNLCAQERWPKKESEQLIRLLKSRMEQEAHVQSILEPEDFAIFQEIENRSLREIAPYIVDRYTLKSDKSRLKKFTPQEKSWEPLLNLVKQFPAMHIDGADALYSALLTKRGLLTEDEHLTAPFLRCSLCWRFVPSRFVKNKQIRCKYHNYSRSDNLPSKKRGYEHGLKIRKAGNVGKIAKKIADTLYGTISIQLEVKADLIEWMEFWDSPCEAQKKLPHEVAWPQSEVLFEHVPSVMQWMQKENWHAIPEFIKAIMPIHPLANEEEQNFMQAYHRIWEANFFLFIPDLAHAEAWLQESHRIRKK